MNRTKIRSIVSGGVFLVSANVFRSGEFRMSTAPGFNCAGVSAIDSDVVALRQAAKAACFSGIGYAKRVLKCDLFSIEITDLSGQCRAMDVEGFAVAVLWLIAIELGGDGKLGDLNLGNWEICCGAD